MLLYVCMLCCAYPCIVSFQSRRSLEYPIIIIYPYISRKLVSPSILWISSLLIVIISVSICLSISLSICLSIYWVASMWSCYVYVYHYHSSCVFFPGSLLYLLPALSLSIYLYLFSFKSFRCFRSVQEALIYIYISRSIQTHLLSHNEHST